MDSICKEETSALWIGDMLKQYNKLDNSVNKKDILLECIFKNIKNMKNDIFHIHYKLKNEQKCRCMKRVDGKKLSIDEILSFSSHYIQSFSEDLKN